MNLSSMSTPQHSMNDDDEYLRYLASYLTENQEQFVEIGFICDRIDETRLYQTLKEFNASLP